MLPKARWEKIGKTFTNLKKPKTEMITMIEPDELNEANDKTGEQHLRDLMDDFDKAPVPEVIEEKQTSKNLMPIIENYTPWNTKNYQMRKNLRTFNND